MDWSETMRKAVILAEAKGYITFDELNQILPPNLRSEDLESLMAALSDNGIWIQEDVRRISCLTLVEKWFPGEGLTLGLVKISILQELSDTLEIFTKK
jgi:hypothetical protein